MNHVNAAHQTRTGAPLPLVADAASDPACCHGGNGCDGTMAVKPAEAPPEPPVACCGDLVCVPIADAATGRELGPDDWGWWARHMAYQPLRPGQAEIYEENRRRFLELGEYLHRTLPPGPDRTYTLRQLGQVLMCANNTVAAHGLSVRITV